jgi:hypothetical protein
MINPQNIIDKRVLKEIASVIELDEVELFIKKYT